MPDQKTPDQDTNETRQDEESSSNGRWIAVIIILIILLGVYGGYKYFSGEEIVDESSDSDTIVTSLTTDDTETEEPVRVVTPGDPCTGNSLTRADVVRLHTTKSPLGGDQAVLLTGSVNGATDTVGGVVNCTDGSSDLYVFAKDKGYVENLKVPYRTPAERDQNRAAVKRAVESALSK